GRAARACGGRLGRALAFSAACSESGTKDNDYILDLGWLKMTELCDLRPLACRITNGGGTATFDYAELKSFSEHNPTGSFVVKNEQGGVVGIMHANFIRDWFLEQAEDWSSRTS